MRCVTVKEMPTVNLGSSLLGGTDGGMRFTEKAVKQMQRVRPGRQPRKSAVVFIS